MQGFTATLALACALVLLTSSARERAGQRALAMPPFDGDPKR
jgi:hypothetical protein